MDREIKFRIKIKGDAKIWEVYAIDFLNLKILRSVSGSYEWVDFDKVQAWMQYTGLPDCNEKNIAERDRVKISSDEYYSNDSIIFDDLDGLWTFTGIVKMDNFMWIAESSADKIWIPLCDVVNEGLDIKITGNIYENPEIYRSGD